MSITKIDNKDAIEIFRKGINDSIVEAAEREIQDALKKIERTMRERVASIAVSMVQGELDIFPPRESGIFFGQRSQGFQG